MKTLRSNSFLFPMGAAAVLLTLVVMGQKPVSVTQSWEYKVVDDVEQADTPKLASDGWEYAGYLGQGVKGASNDQTLWRRPCK